MKTVVFVSRDMAEAINPKDYPTHAMISISCPGDIVNLQSGWKYLLSLEFDDIDQPVKKKSRTLKLFDESQARKIISFLENLESSVSHLVVHCDAGISRSGAVAKFVENIYKARLVYPKINDIYNKHVYSTLMKIQHKKVEHNCPVCGHQLVDGELREYETLLEHVTNPNCEKFPERPTLECCNYYCKTFKKGFWSGKIYGILEGDWYCSSESYVFRIPSLANSAYLLDKEKEMYNEEGIYKGDLKC